MYRNLFSRVRKIRSQWKDDPQRCQSVSIESTMHEKGTVNVCSRSALVSSTALSSLLCPCAGICPLNLNIKHSKNSFGFCFRMCERKGQDPGNLNPEPEAERTDRWILWNALWWSATPPKGCLHYHFASPLTPGKFFFLRSGAWALNSLATIHGLTTPR